MNNTPLVSIVVPVYNVEKYLDECVESIINQDYINIEIILVDDGSKDSSGRLCDELAKKDHRIIVIHKENGGLSSARNAGMEVFKGEYITFIDSDDAVSSDFISLFLKLITENDLDFVQGSFCRDKKNLELHPNKEVYVYKKPDALKAFLKRDRLYVSACAKLYKAEIVKGITFPYGLLNEDNFTTYKFVHRAERCGFVDRQIYWHRMNEGSIMQSRFSERKFAVLKVPEEMREYLSDELSIYRKEIDYYAFRLNISVYNRLLVQSDRDEFISEKKKIYSDINNFPTNDIPGKKFKFIKFLIVNVKPVYKLMIILMFKKGKIS